MMYAAGHHIRAGRKLLGWTAGQLGREAGLGLDQVISLEDDRLEMRYIVDRAARALVVAGVQFLRPEECGRSGVALCDPIPPGRQRKRRRSDLLGLAHTPAATRKGIEQRRMIDAACGLLKWRRATLAHAAGVKKTAVDSAWRDDGPLPPWMADAMFTALRRAGVSFQPSDLGKGPAVALIGRPAWHGFNVLVFVGHDPRGWE